MFEKLLSMENPHPSLISDGVPPEQQTMSTDKSFWIFFTPNFVLSTWILGVFIAQGLGFWPAVTAIILGGTVAVIPTAILARMGPQLGLTQIESTRYSLGRHGVKLPAFLNWFASIGWDAVNNVPAAGAFIALIALTGYTPAYWACLAMLVTAQTVVAIYGHHVTQSIAKYLGYVLPVLFIGLGIRAIASDGHIALQVTGFSWKAFILSVGLVVTGSTSWLAYAADYTRYLKPSDSQSKLFWRVYGGIFLSQAAMTLFGVITAAVIKDTSTTGMITGLQQLAGSFAPLVLLLIVISTVPANAINDNSAAYCLVTAGIRIMRPLSALIGALIGFALALYGASQMLLLLQNVMMLMLYWLLAWGGIAIVQVLDPLATSRKTGVWPPAATIFVLVTVICTALFASNELYIGPIAKALGGVDIGYYVAFASAALLYWLTLRKQSTLATNHE